jgi:hypothetical protein
MKISYKNILPLTILIGSLTFQSVGCNSLLRKLESEDDRTKRILGVQNDSEINNYFCGYKSSKRAEADIWNALMCPQRNRRDYHPTVCKTFEQIDRDKNNLITDKEAREFIGCQKRF